MGNTTAADRSFARRAEENRIGLRRMETLGPVFAVFAVSLAVMLYLNGTYRGDFADDAYIHLRIAGNLVRTGHAYFNPGERVMVTSSPVWILLLAANELVFGTRNVLWIWNAIFSGMAAGASYWLAWEWIASRRVWRKVAALLLPVVTMAILFRDSIMGMESALAVALLLLAAIAFVRSSAAALPLLAIAAFTRYELAVVFAVAGIVCLATRTARRHGAVPAAVISGALGIWVLAQFHTIFPNTITAKSRGYVLSARTSWFAVLPPSFSPKAESVLVLLLVACLGAWALQLLLDSKRREPIRIAAIALSAWGVLLGALYVAKHAFISDWYLPLVWAPLAVGMLLLILMEESIIGKTAPAALLLGVLFGFLFFFGICFREGVTGQSTGKILFDDSVRVHEYLAAGALLHEVCPQSPLMTSEIGALGYNFRGEILDGFGLASPEAIKYHPMRVPEERSNGGIGAIAPGFVLEKNPDLIVSYSNFAEAVLASPAIAARYDDLQYYPVLPAEAYEGYHAPWGIRALHVLVKKNGDCSASAVSAKLDTALIPESAIAARNR